MRMLSITLSMIVSVSPCLADQYLCVADHSGGFRWNGSDWALSPFKIDNAKFLISSLSDEEKKNLRTDLPYKVVQVGSKVISNLCKPIGLAIYCDYIGVMQINLETLRFAQYYTYGYADGEDKNENNPAITIGKCVKM